MNTKKHLIIFIFGILLVLISVNINQKSNYKNGIDKIIYYGYPLGFVEQNFHNSRQAEIYYQQFSLKREDVDTKFLVGRFLVSLLCIFLFLEVLIYILEIIDFKIRVWLFNLIAKYRSEK